VTYESNLTETQQGLIPELYDFESGGNYDRYTSFSEDLTFQGVLYQKATIKRSGFTVDTEFGKITMSIQAPIMDSLRPYIANQPIEVTRVTIWRALYSDLTEYRVLFKGDILKVSMKGPIAQASCESHSHILSQKIPTVVYQSWCNHEVFDNKCGLEETAWYVPATLSAIDEGKYTSTAFGAYADGYFNGGQLLHENDARYITNHVGNDVWLHVPFDARVVVGSEMNAMPGCDGSPTTCKTKFNNWSEYLGMPYIPSSNPVMWGFK
jgi:uncharacterized phage protein (TIGR02218 family)